MSQRHHNKGGTGHSFTLIIKSAFYTVGAVEKFVLEVCLTVNLVSSKYSTKQHTSAQLCTKQMRKIWYKNIRAFLRYRDFRVEVFFWFTLYINRARNVLRGLTVRLRRRRYGGCGCGCGCALSWALTTRWRALWTSVTADGGWSPVNARVSWSDNSATVTGKAPARFSLAAGCKLHTQSTSLSVDRLFSCASAPLWALNQGDMFTRRGYRKR